MTRETKIGLLVGLAFIIVIGILLSDHLTSSTEPPQATLVNAGSGVRSGVTTPGSMGQQPLTVSPPISVAPQQPVATQSELAPRPDPVSIVKVGPSNSTSNANSNSDAQPVRIALSSAANTTPTSSNNTDAGSSQTSSESASNAQETAEKPPVITPQESADNSPTITRVPENSRAAKINAEAAAHGEEVVALDANGRAVNSKQSSPASKAGVVDYKVEAGDSLSKIASKVMGTNSKANRDAIIAANPSLKENPDRVIVGRTYHVPVAAAGAAVPASTVMPKSAIAMNPTAPDTNTATPVEPTKSVTKIDTHAAGENWYVVKAGDSLWRIASDQCGNASAIDAIKELNKTALKGDEHDVVIVGSKLKLPNKPVSAS